MKNSSTKINVKKGLGSRACSFFIIFLILVSIFVGCFKTNFANASTTDTIGNTSSTGNYINAGLMRACPITASESGTLDSIGLNVATAAGNIRLGIYSTLDSGILSGLLGESVSTPAVNGWNDLEIDGGVTITQGNTYYLAVQCSTDSLYYYLVWTGDEYYATTASFTNFPDPSSATTYESWVTLNLRMTYSESSAYYPYVQQISDVDSTADIGTHSNFTAQQDLGNTYDTLTEADVGGSALTIGKLGTDTTGTGNSAGLSFSHTLVSGDNRIVVVTIGLENAAAIDVTGVTYGGVAMTKAVDITFTATYHNIAEIWYILETSLPSTGSKTVAITCSGTASSCEINAMCSEYENVAQEAPEATDADGQSSGSTITSTISPSNGAWVISAMSAGNTGSFTHNNGQIEIRDFNDASSVFAVAELRGGNGETSLASTFSGSVNRLARVAASFAPATAPNYQLSLEEQFTEIPANNASELCIYTGTLAVESLQVQGWNPSNSTWTNIGSVTSASSWNNFTVTSWTGSATDFYIRFIGATETGDTSQSSWQIDAVYLYAYNSTSGVVAVFVLPESVSTTASLASQKALLRGVSESVAVSAVLVDNKGLTKSLTQTVTIEDNLASNKALSKGLTVSVAVAASLSETWGISRVLPAVVGVSSSMISSKSLTNTLTAFVTVANSLDITKALLKQLSEVFTSTLNVDAALAVQKSIGNIFAETIQALASLTTSKNLLQHLTETLTGLLSVSDGLSVQKGLSRLFTETAAIIESTGFVKDLARVFASTITVSIGLDSSKGILQQLSEILTGQVGITGSLSVLKGLSHVFTETLSTLVNLVSSKNILQHLSEILSANLNIADGLQVSKMLSHIFASVISATSGFVSNVGLNHIFSEVLTGVVAPNAALTVQKGLSQFFAIAISISSDLIIQGDIILKSLMFVLSETVSVQIAPQVSLALSVAFLEFVEAVNIGDLLHFTVPLSSEMWLVVGGILAGIIVAMLALCLFMVRKNN